VIDVQTGTVLKSTNYDHIGDRGQLLIKGMKDVVNQLITGLNQEPKEIGNLMAEPIQDKYHSKADLLDGIRKKYPVYSSWDDEELYTRWIAKYPKYPNSIETEILANSEIMKHGQNYLVSIDNIFLDESDFGKYKTGLFGSLSIYISVYKNYNHGQGKWDNSKNLLFDTKVSKRGLIGINEHKTLKFNKDYVYEIAIIEGELEFLDVKKYWIKSEKGDWMFRKGKVQFGKNSYIELSQVLK